MAHILVTEIAKQYGISRRTVLRMINRGELQAEKIEWSNADATRRTGPYVLDSEQVAEVFAARAERRAEPASPAAGKPAAA